MPQNGIVLPRSSNKAENFAMCSTNSFGGPVSTVLTANYLVSAAHSFTLWLLEMMWMNEFGHGKGCGPSRRASDSRWMALWLLRSWMNSRYIWSVSLAQTTKSRVRVWTNNPPQDCRWWWQWVCPIHGNLNRRAFPLSTSVFVAFTSPW